ncbi:MAG: hypothetical protein ACOCWO_04000 [Candidatus Muiribacteriaceae bacterium]
MNRIDNNAFSSVFRKVQISKENDFKIGEVLKGKVMGFSEGKPILSLKKDIYSAESKVPLKLGQEINVFVEKKEQGKTFLKLIDPESRDTDSRLLNNMIAEGVDTKKIDLARDILGRGLSMKQIMFFLKRELPLKDSFISLFRHFTEKDAPIRGLPEIAKDLMTNGKESVLMNILLKRPDTGSVISYLKESLSSTENKLLHDKELNSDLKSALSQDSTEKNRETSDFIDLNNILSKDDDKEFAVQIPFRFDQDRPPVFSQLQVKSSRPFREKDVVNIFFVLDLSNSDLLQISSSYYVKGKNIDIRIFSEKKLFRKMLDENKHMLSDALKRHGVNSMVTVCDIPERSGDTRSDIRNFNPGGIDIKV